MLHLRDMHESNLQPSFGKNETGEAKPKAQSIEFIHCILKQLSEILDKRNFLSLASTSYSINRSITRNHIEFLHQQDLYRKIFTDQVICSMVGVSKKTSSMIEEDPVLKTRLIQAQIIQKMTALLSTCNGYGEEFHLLKSIIIKQIMIHSTGYFQNFEKACSLFNDNIYLSCEPEENSGDTDGADIYLFDDMIKALSIVDIEEAIHFIPSNVTEEPKCTTFISSFVPPSRKNPDSAKKFLEMSLQLFEEHLLSKSSCGEYDTNNIVLHLFQLPKWIIHFAPEKGIESFNKALERIEFIFENGHHNPNDRSTYKLYHMFKIDILCEIAKGQAQNGNESEALKTIETAEDFYFSKIYKNSHFIDFLSEGEPEVGTEIEKKFTKIAATLARFNLKAGISLALSFQDIEKQRNCLENVIEGSCKSLIKLIKNELKFDISPDLSVKNRFSEFLTALDYYINDPFIKCQLLLKISRSIKPSKESNLDSWLDFKNSELLNRAIRFINMIDNDNPFKRNDTFLSIAKHFDNPHPSQLQGMLLKQMAFLNQFNDPILIQNDDAITISDMWSSICELQIKFNIMGIEDSISKNLGAIKHIQDLEKKMDAILKLASLTKKQEIFDLAIETGMVPNSKFNNQEDWIGGNLAKIASLDLKQTPFILEKISSLDLRQNPLFVDHIERLNTDYNGEKCSTITGSRRILYTFFKEIDFSLGLPKKEFTRYARSRKSEENIDMAGGENIEIWQEGRINSKNIGLDLYHVQKYSFKMEDILSTFFEEIYY